MKLPETFHRNLVGRQSHSVEPGQQPEASLASSIARSETKRRQRRCSTMLLSPEICVAEVLTFSGVSDRGVASQWPDVNASAGVAGAWWASTVVPQEQERLAASARDTAHGSCRPRNDPAIGCVSRTEWSEATRHNLRYRRANLISSVGRVGRNRSVFIVPKSVRQTVCRAGHGGRTDA